MATSASAPETVLPEGIFSLLDTDLYKLTMQCAVLKYFPDVYVTYGFTNRTPDKKLSRRAFKWLEAQIQKLGNIELSTEEQMYLRTTCTYLNQPYLRYLAEFRFRPSDQVLISFVPHHDSGSDEDIGDVHVDVKGLWVETILYEIPLLALTSEAYFLCCDRDWTYKGQEDKACHKAQSLLRHGCLFSEFGTRRRRDYHTQDLVLQGLRRGAESAEHKGWTGKFTGTSNVHFAMRYGIPPIGTVAHEWFMGVAAITNDYENASEIALRYWTGCFGSGVLGIALTDTFGTPTFLEAFKQPVPQFTTAAPGRSATLASTAASSTLSATDSLSDTSPPIHAPIQDNETPRDGKPQTYAQVFTGVRQDSGDPAGFIKMMRDFYDNEGIREKKTIVFSDSLNIELCLEYMQEAEDAGFKPTFGVGTFLTNDFTRAHTDEKSTPLNIVIKLSSAAGRPAIKISDNIGKNTGDEETVELVKRSLGYVEHAWEGGDESTRWGAEAYGA
ncbi:MAG: nicotinate phosphoribosyltransferase [Piccolia ochrophora]|nr:MAG: nicotinate phosphoribosyltransferase [Piccolia ochrophora]